MKSRGLNIPCIETVEDVLSHSYGVHPTPKVTAPVLPAAVIIGKDVSVEPVHLEQDINVESVHLDTELSTPIDPFEESESEPKSKPLVKSTELESPSKSKRTRKR